MNDMLHLKCILGFRLESKPCVATAGKNCVAFILLIFFLPSVPMKLCMPMHRSCKMQVGINYGSIIMNTEVQFGQLRLYIGIVNLKYSTYKLDNN